MRAIPGVSPEALARLTPAERGTFQTAAGQVAAGLTRAGMTRPASPQACGQCRFTLRPETGAEAVKAHLGSQHYHASRFPVPEPYGLLVELTIRPGQTAHQLAAARGHRVTYRGRRLTYDGCVSTALEAMLAAGTARYEDAPGGRGRAGFRRLWYAAVRP